MTIFEHQGEFNSTFDAVDHQVRCIFLLFPKYQFTKKFLFLLDYTLRELFNNAVEHGNQLQGNKKVSYRLSFYYNRLEIQVVDEGVGFDLNDINGRMEPKIIAKNRRRGLASIMEMGFELQVDGNMVQAVIDLRKAGYLEESGRVMMEFVVRGDTVFCDVNTSLIATNVKELAEQFKAEIERRTNFDYVTLNLEKSESIDSMGITFLIGIYKTLLAQGKRLKLTGVSEAMLQLFKIMKLDELFELTNG